MESEDYVNLRAGSRSLLFEFAYQYKGKNNGNISATYNQMKKRGLRSPTTLAKALKALIAAKMIIKTRQGGKNYPCLYAVTWRPIDECRGKNLELALQQHHQESFRLSQRRSKQRQNP